MNRNKIQLNFFDIRKEFSVTLNRMREREKKISYFHCCETFHKTKNLVTLVEEEEKRRFVYCTDRI